MPNEASRGTSPWANLPYPGKKRPGPNGTQEEYVEGHWGGV